MFPKSAHKEIFKTGDIEWNVDNATRGRTFLMNRTRRDLLRGPSTSRDRVLRTD